MEKTKIIGFGKLVIRNRPIKRVGIDTNLIYSWIKNEKYLGKYKPKFCRLNDKLFINYQVFGELMNLLSKKEHEIEQVRKLIFDFLRKNNISLLKKRFIDEKKLAETLKKLEKEFGGNIDRSDLKIIAIFYCFDINCIFSANNKHFEEPCKFLGLNYEKHFEIEIGSEQDVRRMLKSIYPKKFGKKRY